jgi:hypothetical protein
LNLKDYVVIESRSLQYGHFSSKYRFLTKKECFADKKNKGLDKFKSMLIFRDICRSEEELKVADGEDEKEKEEY